MTGSTTHELDTAVVDLDGTLVDSTYHHVLAWSEAFAQVGIPVESWRLHQSMGMGGDRLVEAVANSAVEASRGDTLRGLWKHNYDLLLQYVRPCDGARELLQALARRGLRVVIASSGNPQHTKRALRILRLDRDFPVVDADDVEASKPAPDLVQAAVDKVDGSHAVMIGDTLWDIEAAESCGLRTLALCTGGTARGLLAESAAGVYETPRDLADHLTEALDLAAVPLPNHMSSESRIDR